MQSIVHKFPRLSKSSLPVSFCIEQLLVYIPAKCWGTWRSVSWSYHGKKELRRFSQTWLYRFTEYSQKRPHNFVDRGLAIAHQIWPSSVKGSGWTCVHSENVSVCALCPLCLPCLILRHIWALLSLLCKSNCLQFCPYVHAIVDRSSIFTIRHSFTRSTEA